MNLLSYSFVISFHLLALCARGKAFSVFIVLSLVPGSEPGKSKTFNKYLLIQGMNEYASAESWAIIFLRVASSGEQY